MLWCMGMKTIILDHDLGTNPDDFFSLLMLLNDENVHLPLVISGNNHPVERACMARKIIQQHGTDGVRVVAGEQTGHIEFNAHHLLPEECEGIATNYQECIKTVLDTHDEVVYLCIQGVSNVTSFLKDHPEYIDTFEIIHMGMSLSDVHSFVGGGTNMESDPQAAKYLYQLNLQNFKVVGSHTTIQDSIRVTPETELYRKIASSTEPNHKMLYQHLREYNQRRGLWPALHDPLTTSVALGHEFVSFEEVHVDFNTKGEYCLGSETRVLNSKTEINNPEQFMQLCADLV
jgi:inosine-uridine nucleoside N-ribohydrolase